MTDWRETWQPRAAGWISTTRDRALAPKPEPRPKRDPEPRFRPGPTDADLADARQRGEALRRMGEESDRAWRVAFHESAHVYVARALGLPVVEVVIDLDTGAGHTLPDDKIASDALDVLTLLCAGGRGELLRFPTIRGASSDEESIRAVLFEVVDPRDREATLRQARAAAERLVRDGEAAITELAHVLVRRRQMSGEDALAILGEFDTRTSDSDQEETSEESLSGTRSGSLLDGVIARKRDGIRAMPGLAEADREALVRLIDSGDQTHGVIRPCPPSWTLR